MNSATRSEQLQDRNVSTTFLKGLEVLQTFRDEDADLTQSAIAARLGYDRATVRRLCLTLVRAGFITQSNRADRADRSYRLSPRVLTLAGAFLRANEIGHIVQPALNEHAAKLGSDIGLAVHDGDRALYVAQSTTAAARVSFGLTVGSTLPLLPTAVGRMLLATLPPQARGELIATLPLERHTTETCMDRDEIAGQVAGAAEAGASVVHGEYERGICALAVPIGTPDHMPGVVGTTLPLAQPGLDARIAEALCALTEAATHLGRLRALERW